MRVSIVASALLVLGIGHTHAAALKDCSVIKGLPEKLACVDENTKLVNAEIADSIKAGQTVVLQSSRAAGECVTWMTAGGEIKSRDCGGESEFNGWIVKRK